MGQPSQRLGIMQQVTPLMAAQECSRIEWLIERFSVETGHPANVDHQSPIHTSAVLV